MPVSSQAVPAIYQIHIVDNDAVYRCSADETLLQGMARLGRKGIPAGCLNGGCGVCKVAIRSGKVNKTGPMSRVHVNEQEEAQGIVLACRVAPASAIEVEVVGKLKKAITRSPWGAIVT
ncbi:2Fe-2S iron-sulfur cluster binding domain-containing protein [Pseudoxanthomonas spadix]|uniref:2Fe-2S iron-sulfur cluster binding domain-containing protein n=1 Tax=Pseudoxanthomonas spadix TaxID=415229 RepID=UPI0003138862|nr:2Fe-2S iron-sulfur cluster binding domain-containing protein [Pseudoxanthomonas spadix]